MDETGATTVTVVLPVHDGACHLDAALDSLRQQGHGDLRVLVVDNGSRDATPQIVARHAAQDPRIELVRLESIGLVPALNHGLDAATTRYVARMDADDVCHPDRFAAQVEYLRAHPRCAAVGTGYRLVDVAGRELGVRRPPAGSARIRAARFFGNPLAHPTVMLDTARIAVRPRYVADYPDAEDFDLWLRISESHDVNNLPAPLLSYRLHDQSVTGRGRATARASSVRALVDSSPWRPRLAAWVLAGTYNAADAGVGVIRFAVAVVVLNALNAGRPMAPRGALLVYTPMAVASYARQRLRRGAPRARHQGTG